MKEAFTAIRPLMRSRQQGFTLTELSIVLVIIALITGMSAASGITILSSARVAATNQKMAAIDQALLAYRMANNRLPCPTDLTLATTNTNYGYEANYNGGAGSVGTGSCTGGTPAANYTYAGATNTKATAAEGGVPAATLGLPSDFMYDGWGGKFRYIVDMSMTASGAFTATQIGAVCGPITVNAGPAYPAASARTTGAVYALLSHGPNMHGAYTRGGGSTPTNANSNNSDELANCHCTNTGAHNAGLTTPNYVQEPPYNYLAISQTNKSYDFDDIVTFKERWQMQAPGDVPGTSCPRVFVADSGSNRILVYDLQGNYLFPIGSAGTGNNQLSSPTGVSPDTQGNLWVADTGNNRAEEFAVTPTAGSNSGAGINMLRSTPTTPTLTTFDVPKSVVVDNSNNVWVLDTGTATYVNSYRASRYNATSGAWATSIGHNGGTYTCIPDVHTSPYNIQCISTTSTDGFGNTAEGMAVDINNNVYIADPSNNRVMEFDSSQTNKLTITGLGAPKAVAVDASGNIWTAESGGVKEYNSSGTNISTASFGSSLFSAPEGIAVDPMGYIWVSDTGHSKIYKCSVPTPPSAPNASGTNCTQVTGATPISPKGIGITAR